MKKYPLTSTVHVQIHSINLPILIENIGTNSSPLYFAKCGHFYNGHAVTCAGLYWNESLAIKKCISEFCERVSLLFNDEDESTEIPIAPFAVDESYGLAETFTIINSYPSNQKWRLPISLFNPRISPNAQKIDGTGFASHMNWSKATLHALCEIYERHCVGLLWDSGDGVKLARLECNMNSTINSFLKKNILELDLFKIITNDDIPMECVIAILLDQQGHCYFGSAARTQNTVAMYSSTLEAILMFMNINSIWNTSTNVTGRIKELLESYNRSSDYIKYINSKLDINFRRLKTFTNERNAYSPQTILETFKKYFDELYYKKIGLIQDRRIIKYIIPRAYIRYPYGFKRARNHYNTKPNPLPYPFG